jgi:hypothetical protein
LKPSKMEAVSSSETTVNFCPAIGCQNSEGSIACNHGRENLSHYDQDSSWSCSVSVKKCREIISK